MKYQYYVISKDRKHTAFICTSELEAQIALQTLVSPWLYKIQRFPVREVSQNETIRTQSVIEAKTEERYLKTGKLPGEAD